MESFGAFSTIFSHSLFAIARSCADLAFLIHGDCGQVVGADYADSDTDSFSKL